MQNITSAIELRKQIQLLEIEQAFSEKLLKEQLYITYESFKPINLIKNALSEVATSPSLIDNIIGGVVGLATGYLTKKIVIGASGGIFKKVLGSLMQFGVTSAVSQHPDAIKSVGKYIFQHIFRKKETNTEKGV